jgi:sulfoacetaldehyde dehydrogenase
MMGSQSNVKRPYTSGTPALAVGTGNDAVIVDETCKLIATTEKPLPPKPSTYPI